MKEVLNLLLSLSQELKSVKAYMEVFHKSRFQKLEETWIDSNQAKALLRISSQTLRNLRKNGVIAHSSINSKIYYKMDDIERLLNENYSQTLQQTENDNHKK